MNKPKQPVALLALLLAFVMLFSVLYIVLEADHDCCGEDCAVCAQLAVCENLLRNLLPLAVLLSAGQVFCALVQAAADDGYCFAGPRTLIALKVKLSN